MKKKDIKIISLFSSIILVIGIIFFSGSIIFKNDEKNVKNMLSFYYDGESHKNSPLKDSGYEIEVVNCDKAVEKDQQSVY